jgi:hypothetical protein
MPPLNLRSFKHCCAISGFFIRKKSVNLVKKKGVFQYQNVRKSSFNRRKMMIFHTKKSGKSNFNQRKKKEVIRLKNCQFEKYEIVFFKKMQILQFIIIDNRLH